MSRVSPPGGFRGTASRLFPVDGSSCLPDTLPSLHLRLFLLPARSKAWSPILPASRAWAPSFCYSTVRISWSAALLTNGEGGFAFGDLVPDVYSVRVTLVILSPGSQVEHPGAGRKDAAARGQSIDFIQPSSFCR